MTPERGRLVGLFALCSVAAVVMQIYDRHPPPADLVLMPSNAVCLFAVVPFAAAVAHDARDRLALALAALAAAVALGPALYWAYHPDGSALRREPEPFAVAAVVAVVLVGLAAARGRIDLGAWGLRLGAVRTWVPLVGVLLALIAVGIPVVAWLFPDFIAFYPRHRPARTDVVPLLQHQLSMAVYMASWEFLFRGFLLFGTARTLGPVAAVLLQAFPFFLLHDTKPEIEMAASFVGGIGVAWLCWHVRSVWPSVVLHCALFSTTEVTAFVFRNFSRG